MPVPAVRWADAHSPSLVYRRDNDRAAAAFLARHDHGASGQGAREAAAWHGTPSADVFWRILLQIKFGSCAIAGCFG
jgi:hypothetical protein